MGSVKICDKLSICIASEFEGKRIDICGDRGGCIESSDTRRNIKCEENGKKYILENTLQNHVISYRMDGGVVKMDRYVPRSTMKCDYLFVVKNNERNFAILIELKGKDVKKSLEQIFGTIQLYGPVFHELSCIYARVVVASSTPKITASPEYVKLRKLMRKYGRGNVVISERQLKETDVKLDNAR